MKTFIKLMFLLCVCWFGSCKEEDIPKSSEKSITGFVIGSLNPSVNASINGAFITATIPSNSNIATLVPNITISAKASITPASGVAQDFSNPVIYTVTAEDGSTQRYTVTITKEKNTDKAILKFTFATLNPVIDATINESAKGITATLPASTDLTKLVPTIVVSEKASISPASGVIQNFSKDVVYTVTAEDGSTQRYTASISKIEAPLDPPTLTLQNATNITTSTAELLATITKIGNKPITGYGFVYSDVNKNPTSGADAIGINIDTKAPAAVPFPFKGKITNLRANTLYYYRAIITVQLDNAFPQPKTQRIETEVKTFTTLADATIGSWIERKDITNTSLRSYEFYYKGLFYRFSFKEISAYSPTEKKDILNVGPQFPGTGYMGKHILRINSKVYFLMNGESGVSKITKEVWEYDLDNKKWARKADFVGIPRASAIGLVANGKIYFGTGNEYITRPGIATQLKDWYEYDPTSDKWTQKADFVATANSLSGFTTSNNNIVVGLGFTNSVNTIWRTYLTEFNSWGPVGRPPTTEHRINGAVVWQDNFNGRNFVLFENTAGTAYSMWVFNPSNVSWSKAAQLPVSLSTSVSGRYLKTFDYDGKPILLYEDDGLKLKTLFEFKL